MDSIPNISPGGSYDIIQTVFKLSMLANAANLQVSQSTAQLEALLTQKINTAFQEDVGAIGSWQIVWGPAVFEHENSGTVDNAIYVAHNAAINHYVVGVAATNAQSKYDIYRLDLNVNATTPFPSGVQPSGCPSPAGPSAGNISRGTALGITNLLQLTGTSRSGPMNLQNFLTSVAGAGATLVFTGHSLGSALAPALALWLYPQPTKSPWTAVYVLPTAGPTPGDEGFKTGFTTAFPQVSITGVKSDYGFWNTLLWNEFDVVPHAWTNIMRVQPTVPANDVLWGDLLNQSLYGPLKKYAAVILPMMATGLYVLPGMSYARLPDKMFSSGYSPSPVSSKKEFGIIALNQHVQAYADFFGVPLRSEVVAGIGISLLSMNESSLEVDAEWP